MTESELAAQAKAAYHERINLRIPDVRPIAEVDTSSPVGHARAVLVSKSLGAPVTARQVRDAEKVLLKAGINPRSLWDVG